MYLNYFMANNTKLKSNDKYLDFKDILILPRSSELNSRSDVNLNKTITFKNNEKWKGIPIIASNMNTIGTFEMYKVLSKYNIITALHKFYKLQDFLNYNKENPIPLNKDYFMISTGISNSDYQNLIHILDNIDIKFICVDVANGYINNFKTFCKHLRTKYPQKIICAGNVTTREGVYDLINIGIDIIKCGIGGGCFKGDTRILMSNGNYKNIEDISEGDYVINKNGKPVKVLKKINNGIKDFINIKTNNWHTNTYVTAEHEFWIHDLSYSNIKTNYSSEKSKYKWENIENCFQKKNLLMPKSIDWDLPENFCIDLSEYNLCIKLDNNYIYNEKEIKIKRFINSNYDLGYIFGTYLGDPNSYITINNNKEPISCHWLFNINEYHISNKLISYIYNIIEYSCSVKKINNNILIISCYNNNFAKLLYMFSKKTNKFLPEKFYCKNKHYIQGIFDGLIDSHGNIEISITKKNIYNLTNSNKYILELFYWCCMNLQIPYSSNICKKSIEKFKKTYIHNIKDLYQIKTHTMNHDTKNYIYSEILNYNTNNILTNIGWDIEVDCETHSFIANNSIVHNSACTTRIQTGIGMPQFSCILECVEAAKKSRSFILSDGGITCPGDLAKSYGAGSDFVMIGGEFAGHDENPGEIIEDKETGIKYKFFYGMSSSYAMNNNYATNNNTNYRSSEGREIKIKYKGPLENTIKNYLGGLRSTCTYTNSKNLEDLNTNCQFIIVNNQCNTNLVNGK